MNIIEEYKQIQNPIELFEFMEKYIKYGIHGTDGKNYRNDGSKESNERFQKASRMVYRLASPEYILKYCLGHCWDQVELERDWFAKHEYTFKTIFIWFQLDFPNTYSCHSYLIYQDKETREYCIFEHAAYPTRGIHRFKTYDEAIKWQYEKHIELNGKFGNKVGKEEIKYIHIYEYECPGYGVNNDAFYDNIIYNSKDITEVVNQKNSQFTQ